MMLSRCARFLTVGLLLAACTPMARSPARGEIMAARGGGGGEDQTADRVLIRRATADVEVDSIALAFARAIALASSLGGHVDQQVIEERSAMLVLRIPDNRLEPALDSLATFGDMKNRTVSAEDVTTTVIDVEARLANLVASRDRLRDLLGRATSVADIVAVERELARVQGEIDSLEARRNYLRDAAALSRLQLSLSRRVVLGPLGVVAKGVGWVLERLFIWRR